MIITKIILAHIVKKLAIMDAQLTINTGITNCLNKRMLPVVERVEMVVAGEMEVYQGYCQLQGTQG